MTTFKINYGEPPKAKALRTINVITFVVRPPVDHRPGHFLEVLPVNRGFTDKIVLPANSAHRFAQRSPYLIPLFNLLWDRTDLKTQLSCQRVHRFFQANLHRGSYENQQNVPPSGEVRGKAWSLEQVYGLLLIWPHRYLISSLADK